MFGYIRIYEDELKVRSLKLYKSVYCGLCKTAEKRFGYFSKMFLSYDYTFFSVVRMIFTDAEIKSEKRRCGFHLFKKKDVIAENDELRLSAAIFSILTYYKLLDNIRDEKPLKALAARLVLPFASAMRKKALKGGFSEVDFIVSDCMERISELEKARDVTTDEISGVFGDMMGSLLKMGLSDEKKNDAYTVGYNVGKFIYVADALDDVYEDEKNGSFNPMLFEFKDAESARSTFGNIKNVFLSSVDTAADILWEMKNTLSHDGKRLCEVALNILYLGCPSVIEGILYSDSKKK